MLKKQFVLNGSDLKEMPLEIGYYSRTYGVFSEENQKSQVEFIKDWVHKNTCWDISCGYEDTNYSSIDWCGQPELCELVEDSSNYPPFDLIVVTDFHQITRGKESIEMLLDDGFLKVPVFCIDTEDIVASDPINTKQKLIDSSRERTLKQLEKKCVEKSRTDFCDIEEIVDDWDRI